MNYLALTTGHFFMIYCVPSFHLVTFLVLPLLLFLVSCVFVFPFWLSPKDPVPGMCRAYNHTCGSAGGLHTSKVTRDSGPQDAFGLWLQLCVSRRFSHFRTHQSLWLQKLESWCLWVCSWGSRYLAVVAFGFWMVFEANLGGGEALTIFYTQMNFVFQLFSLLPSLASESWWQDYSKEVANSKKFPF